MKTIKKQLISIPKKRFGVLAEGQYNREWYVEFMKGAYVLTDWKVNSKITLKDDSGSGLKRTFQQHVQNVG
jgi:hypothetical protein